MNGAVSVTKRVVVDIFLASYDFSATCHNDELYGDNCEVKGAVKTPVSSVFQG